MYCIQLYYVGILVLIAQAVRGKLQYSHFMRSSVLAAARSIRTADLDLLTASSHLNYTVVHRGGVEERVALQAGS